MSSDEADPWTSSDDEEGVCMVKVFFIHDEEILALEKMRNMVANLAANLTQTVENEGWDTNAVMTAINDINFFLGRGHKKFQGHLLSGLIKRDNRHDKELLLPENVRRVRY
jgi:hypothetical protein